MYIYIFVYITLVIYVIYATRTYLISILSILYYRARKSRVNNHENNNEKHKKVSVSVIIPCHNEESVIAHTLEHLIKQDLPPYIGEYEIIVVNDGSTDSTQAILEKYSANYHNIIKIIKKTRAEGKAKAFNYGVKYSKGDIIVGIDADHYLEKDAISKLIEPIVKGNADIVQGACVIRNRDTNILTKLIAIDYYAGYLAELPGRTFLGSCPIAGSNFAVKREVFEKLGLFDENALAEDTEFSIRAILNGYRIHYTPDSISTEEAVTTIKSYVMQRRRWVNGHFRVLSKYAIRIMLNKNINILEKAELLAFLMIYIVPLFTFMSIVIIYANTLYQLLTTGNYVLVITTNNLYFFYLSVILASSLLFEALIGLIYSRKLRYIIYFPFYLIKTWLDLIVTTIGFVDFLTKNNKWYKTKRMEKL